MTSDARVKMRQGCSSTRVLALAWIVWFVLAIVLLVDGFMAPIVSSSAPSNFNPRVLTVPPAHDAVDALKTHDLTASAPAPAARPALSLEESIAAVDALVPRVMHRYNTRYWLEPRGDVGVTAQVWSGNPGDEKYVSFEPWQGGFNNERMSLEQAAAVAVLLDRTLVLPPKRSIYLRGSTAFTDYFDLADMQRGLRVVSFDDFSKRVGLQAHAGKAPAWAHKPAVWRGIEHVPGTLVMDQKKFGGIASQVVLCDPACPTDRSNVRFNNFASKLKKFDVGTAEVSMAKILHFPNVLLGHFYTFVWAEEPERLRHIRAVVKNGIHFRSDIFAKAERIVDAMGDFAFSALHVRRNDFQVRRCAFPPTMR